MILFFQFKHAITSLIIWNFCCYLGFQFLASILHLKKFYKQYAERNYLCILAKQRLYPGIFFSFIFISWRLITLQYCSGFCHTLTWISHGFTCIPHPNPPSHLPLDPIPLGLPSAPGLSTCLMHPTWAGDLFHPR